MEKKDSVNGKTIAGKSGTENRLIYTILTTSNKEIFSGDAKSISSYSTYNFLVAPKKKVA